MSSAALTISVATDIDNTPILTQIAAYFGLGFAVFALFLLLKSHRNIWFWAGFFTAILWFYWISFSLIYYGFWYLMVFEIAIIAAIYGVIFYLAGFFENTIWRVLGLFAISFIHPFGFNWFNLSLIFIDTFFEPSAVLLALLIGALAVWAQFGWRAGVIATISFIAISVATNILKTPIISPVLPFQTTLAATDTPQSQKWDNAHKKQFHASYLKMIDKAILDGSRLVILPETAFALYIEHDISLLNELLNRSHKIAILAGSLRFEKDNKAIFNSAFLFDKGEAKSFDKHILVPFGEEIPLPAKLKKRINDLFFGGAADFMAADKPSSFRLDGALIRPAICYEASKDELFSGDGDNKTPKTMLAISNNAWFVPSTQSTLQLKLLKYYAQRYQTTIYHTTNATGAGVIYPQTPSLRRLLAP